MPTDKPISAEFPFESKYALVHGSRMHYVEEGAGDPILFLHGNPTSSYLWRNIIPYAARQGRAIAVDLIGMGHSDKPDMEYRFFDHVRYVEGFIEHLNLRNITLVIHDWGSALGFHYASRHESNVKGIAFLEAIVQPATWAGFPSKVRLLFRLFRTPGVGWALIGWGNLFIEKVLPMSILRPLSEEERDYYREPYRTIRSRRPLWRWPNEIPFDGRPADVHEAVVNYHDWLKRSQLPKLLFCAKPGALLRRSQVEWCQGNLANLKTAYLGPGLHFLQEDHPHLIGRELAAWCASL